MRNEDNEEKQHAKEQQVQQKFWIRASCRFELLCWLRPADKSPLWWHPQPLRGHGHQKTVGVYRHPPVCNHIQGDVTAERQPAAVLLLCICIGGWVVLLMCTRLVDSVATWAMPEPARSATRPPATQGKEGYGAMWHRKVTRHSDWVAYKCNHTLLRWDESSCPWCSFQSDK